MTKRKHADRLEKKKPNILWICTDQQRWDTIHALGNRFIHTPNLDGLVERGVAFNRAYCQAPICTPSRASFLTGMYPSSIRACLNGNDHWADAAPLITKILADDGYVCGLAGKLHLSAAAGRIEKRPEDDGYSVYHWSHHPNDDWRQGHDYNDWLKDQGVDYNETVAEYGHMPAEFHQTTWCAEKTIEFIKEKRDAPWLFSLNCFDPHPPLNPPQNYVDRYHVDDIPNPVFRESDLAWQRRLANINFQTEADDPSNFDGKTQQILYWAQIDLIDEQIGRVLDALKETGQLTDTVVIYTSDHGNCVGDHGLRQKGCRFYEGLTRVPLIFSCPAFFEQNVRSQALVELIDIAPTILDLAGLPTPCAMRGKSLTPILTGQVPPEEHRDFVRCEYYEALGGVKTRATMIRDDRFKLVNYHGHNLGELFDLEKDPDEFINLFDAPEYQQVRQRLTDLSFDALAFAIDLGPERIARF